MMTKTLKILLIQLLISLTLIWNSYSQSVSSNNDFLNQNFILSLESGIYYGFTDYQTSNIEPGIRGSIEYFPVIINNARFGLKLFGAGTSLSFSDSRRNISNNDVPSPRTVPTDIYTDIIQIGASVNFGLALNQSLISYLNVGAGYLIFNPMNNDGTKLEFNQLEKYDTEIISFLIEGGLRYKLSDRFGLNLALGYYPTSSDYLDDIAAADGSDSFLFGLVGVSYALGGNPDSDNDGVSDNDDQCPNTPQNVVVDEFGCPIDTDYDGVPDYLDKCSSTPAGIAVDSTGCPIDSDKDGVPDYLDRCADTPANLEVDSFGCPPDADNDGIPDYFDKCSDTRIGIAVDSVGCPVDADKDGIPDYLDTCPGTPLNTKVDSSGCPEETAETFYQFNLRGDDTFNNGSSDLKQGAKLILNEIAFYVQNQLNSKWRIEGHMDSQGSAYTIKKLSYDRAKAVLDYLISQGVSREQLEIYGLGDSFPIGNNNTAEGRSANRRIMIIRED
jgi:outer membrane protein OmpA-like peptidoglycan-associated protein